MTRQSKMQRWVRDSNYIGDDYSEYYVLLTKTPQSDIMTESNFHSALKRLGGESPSVNVVRFNHWLTGWVDVILIHELDVDMVTIGHEIINDLSNYPILDEDDYDSRVNEKIEEYIVEIQELVENGADAHQMWGIDPSVDLTDDEQLRDALYQMVIE
jgi:hypothetical protein